MWHMGNGVHGYWVTWVNDILVNTTYIDGGHWGIRHIANRAHGVIEHISTTSS